MKKIILTSAIILTSLSTNSFAMHNGKATGTVAGHGFAAQECNYSSVKVNGLVCDFCARALEKVFSKKEEVSGIKVDLDNGNVVINYKEKQKITDDELKNLITNAGYDVVSIENKECK
jgi:copper chaperone CopZ